MKRILLFDWTTGGHHVSYLRRTATSLAGRAEVTIAAPGETLAALADVPARHLDLGDPRPTTDFSRPVGPQNQRDGREEVRRFAAAARGFDLAVHMYADPVIRYLASQPTFPTRMAALVFFPRVHYPLRLRTPLPAADLARAAFHELNVLRWSDRRHARLVLTLDPYAARRWARLPGVAAGWLPEPPVDPSVRPDADGARTGVVLYGALGPRKGLDWLAAAVARSSPARLGRITLAGYVIDGSRPEVERWVGAMRDTGVEVELADHGHSEQEGLARLAGARVVVLPYPRHFGMSRVMLEAAAVGTPVVAHARGLVGDVVRREGIGIATDCSDADGLARALERFTAGPVDRGYDEALAAFARRHGREAFDDATALLVQAAG